MMLYLSLTLGGVLGTLARYGIGGSVAADVRTGIPWGTLAVNVLGSLLLGFVMRATEIAPMSAELRLFLTVGFCGAFTTFSALSYETVVLLHAGAWGRAAAYAFGSLALGLAAVTAGLWLAGPIVRAWR